MVPYIPHVSWLESVFADRKHHDFHVIATVNRRAFPLKREKGVKMVAR